MKKLMLKLSIALLMISCTLNSVAADTGSRRFTEDFNSDNFLDLAKSSARWEPERGDMRLPAYLIENIGSYETPGKAWSTMVQDFRLYVSNGYSGIQVYDISDNPEDPIYLGYYDAPGSVHNLFIEGDSLYVACGTEGYKIINKALLYGGTPDPDNYDKPGSDHIISSIIPSPDRNIFGAPLIDSYTYDIEIARDSLAVIAQWDSVKILKVKSENRRYIFDIVDGRDTPAGAIDLTVMGNYIFLSEHNFGLRVLSFVDIDAVLGEYETPGKCYGFDIAGDYLYLAASDAGLHILDISNPESPSFVSSFDTDLDAVDADGYAVNVTVAGDYAYVSEWNEAVVVVDVSDPASPVLAGYSRLEDPQQGAAVNWPWGVSVEDTLVYAANYSGGLKVLRASPSYDASSFTGRSLPVNDGMNQISRVRLETVQEGDLTWRVSADGGANWQPIEPDNSWHEINVPGGELLWESTHYPGDGWSRSSCSSISLQYEGAVATMLAESDAFFDEDAVKVEWSLNGLDGGTDFIISRSVYPEDNFRRIATIRSGETFDYSYIDRDIESGSTYYYRVRAENNGNGNLLFQSGPVSVPAALLALYQNEPNPFNPSTRIRFNMPERGRVVINIYDVSGRLVKSLVDGVMGKGINSVVWNGRDNAGRAANSGVYFYTLNSGKNSITRKLVLLR